MGCYDTIEFPCPKCGKAIYAQTKSGECLMENYSFDDVPLGVAQDANRHGPFECCGKYWRLDDIPRAEDTRVKLSVVEAY